MRKIICRIIERVFPAGTNRVNAARNEKRTAMQVLLDANRILRASMNYRRESADQVGIINARLSDALRAYERGRYGDVVRLLPRA